MSRPTPQAVLTLLCLMTGLIAAGAGVQAAVTVDIVEPANLVATVGPVPTQFRATLTEGGEDHTAQATFVWSFQDGIPEGWGGNPASAAFASLGTKLVSVTGYYNGQHSLKVKSVRVIGGNGECDYDGVFFFWHAPYDQPTYYARARPDQPEGVTYEWVFIEGADKVDVIDGYTNADIHLRPIHSSIQPQDIKLRLDYKLAGTTAGYRGAWVTNHKPTVTGAPQGGSRRYINAVDADHQPIDTTGPPEWQYGYWNAYDCRSQFDVAMEGMPFNEEFTYYPDNPPGVTVLQGDAVVPQNGRLWDVWVCRSSTEWPGPPGELMLHAAQYIWVGGWHNENTLENPFWLNERVDWSAPAIVCNPLDGHN